MKKVMTLLLSFCILLCACQVESTLEELRNLPTASELQMKYKTMNSKERDAYKQQIINFIEATSDQEIYESIDSTIEEWKNTQQPFEIALVATTYTKDDLLMMEGINQKAISNMDLVVDIHWEGLKASENDYLNTFADTQNNMLYFLTENLYSQYKLANIKVNHYNEKGYNVYSINPLIGTGTTAPKANVGRSESIFALQTIVYDFVLELNKAEFQSKSFDTSRFPNGNATLKRFGIRENEKDLYIEIPIYEVDYKIGAQAYANRLQSAIAEGLKESIIEKGEKHLKENNIDTITIHFYVPWNNINSSNITRRFAVA